MKGQEFHDRAVTDVNFSSLKPDDQANMMRRIFTSDKKCLSTLNNDVVEVDLKMDLVKSRDLLIHIKNIHKSSKGHLIYNKMVVTVKT